jgi:hypothetical protein
MDRCQRAENLSEGKELQTAYYVSANNHRDFEFHDHVVTIYLPAWD